MKITQKNILIALLAIVLMGGGIVIGVNWNNWFGKKDTSGVDIDQNAEDYVGDKGTYTGKKNTETIDIPGFDSMNLKAGSTQQSVNLYNPEQNTCYFKMSIFLKDGTKLWESKLVAPGKAVYEITLSQSLSAGAYEDCVLKYECFTMDKDQSPLNGSEISFTMNVME